MVQEEPCPWAEPVQEELVQEELVQEELVLLPREEEQHKSPGRRRRRPDRRAPRMYEFYIAAPVWNTSYHTWGTGFSQLVFLVSFLEPSPVCPL